MQQLDANDLRTAFRQQKNSEFYLPQLDNVDWGVLDYFGWLHPSGQQGYAAVVLGDELHGLKLRRMVNHGSKPRTHMCSWCHHVYRSRGTAMFSTAVKGSEGRRRIGNYICKNLDCSLRIRNLVSDPPTYLPETIDLDRKIVRLTIAINSFIGRANQPSQTTY